VSNCITFERNGSVTFTSDDIDIPALSLQIALCKEDDTTWWYLATNTDISADLSQATVHFGRGRSSHTWRDFHATVNHVLNPLMKRRKAHTFVLSDESDGHGSRYKYTVTFGAYKSDAFVYNTPDKCPHCKGTREYNTETSHIHEDGRKVSPYTIPCPHCSPDYRAPKFTFTKVN